MPQRFKCYRFLTMQRFNIWARVGFLAIIFTPFTAGAWGKRGHQIVGEVATLLVSQQPDAAWLRGQSFNFGYYANVPDFIWKRPATYELEKPEHFVDMEVFRREFAKNPDVKNPFDLSRKEFEEKFPDLKPMAGRAFWRIRELNAELEGVTQQLRELKEQTGEARQKLQEKWIVLAGVLAHYIGDLGQPLHVTENHDGQMTDQKGVHSYFEDSMVDWLYPEVLMEVKKEALKEWPAFTKRHNQKTVQQLVMELTDRAEKQLPKLLALDKKTKRENTPKDAKVYEPMIRRQLIDSSLVLAEIYRRQLGWSFDDNKFYFMAGEPAYIKAAEGRTVPKTVKK